MQLSNEIITASPGSVRDTGKHLFWSGIINESLKISIRQIGQTTPVLAQETEDGLELISGHARLAVLRECGEPVLVRLVLDADARDKGLLYLTDNAARPIDDGMRLDALKYFRTIMDTNALRQEIMPLLGIKPKSKDARMLLEWLDLPENWQSHLSAGHVPLAIGPVIARMDKEALAAVEPLFAGFSWSRSNAVNMLTWLFETGKMAAKPVAEVMQDAGINEIMRQGLSPKDTIARLTAAAKTARYPELSRLQNSFTNAARELTAGTKWRIVQPNNFETGGAELTVQVKDATQLAKAIDELTSMAGQSSWQTIWNLGEQND